MTESKASSTPQKSRSKPSPSGNILREKLAKLLTNRRQSEVASAAGINPSHLSKFLRRGVAPKATDALRLARALGVPVEWLIDDAREWPPPALCPSRTSTSDVYRDELEGTRVRFPHSPIHVQASMTRWGTADWKEDRDLLTLTITPAQAAALGLQFVRIDTNDAADLAAAGYERTAAADAPPAPSDAASQPGWLALDPATLDRIRRDPFHEAELRAMDLRVMVDRLDAELDNCNMEHANAVEALRQVELHLGTIYGNRVNALLSKLAPLTRRDRRRLARLGSEGDSQR